MACQDAGARCLLREAAFQLRDQHDNAVETAGVPLRLVLQELPDAAAAGELPRMEAGGGDGALEAETDDRGRVFWDQVSIIQGSGKPLSFAK